MNRVRLRLFVTGNTIRAEQAVGQVRRIMADAPEVEWEFEVVDVLDQPGLAERYKVVATPMLLKHHPPPQRRIIGDLGDRDRVIAELGIPAKFSGGS